MAGIRVVDFTANMAGPMATMIMGDQGADVIKIEPLEGDVIRTIGTSRAGMSAYFANLNRSKRSLSIDLTHPRARRVIDALLDRADVVVQAYRPGVAEKLGLDAQSVKSGRAGIVYAEIVGFGPTGPYARRPAYDHVIQALSGFAAIQADRHSQEPALVRQGIVDKITGQAAAQAITAALLERSRTGIGQDIQVSMLNVALSVLWPDGMMNQTILEPDVERPSIVNTFRLTPTKDGFIAFAVVTIAQLARVLEAVGLDDDDRIATPEGRARHGGEVMRQAAAVLSQRSTEEAEAMLASHGIPVAPVVSLDSLHTHPQIRANASIDEFDHPTLGRIRQTNPGVNLGAHAGELRPAPELGEHSGEVLAELGLGRDEIEDLRRARVFGGR